LPAKFASVNAAYWQMSSSGDWDSCSVAERGPDLSLHFDAVSRGCQDQWFQSTEEHNLLAAISIH
jgi:hypothetical protein